jgi:versiconal hemiacetal acetate esterase
LRGPVTQYGSFDEQFNELGGVLVQTLKFPAPIASVNTEDKEISAGIKVRIYTPSGYAGNKPVCLFFHGGGWAMGDLDGEDHQLRTISKDARVVIVSVDYRLAPKNPYPAGLDDCVAAYKWALENSEYLNTTPNEAITFGTSAGGNLALSTALKLIDAGEASTLKGVVAVVPVTVLRSAIPEELKSKYTSYDEHANHTINTASGMQAFVGKLY